jgi:HSP20 family protein
MSESATKLQPATSEKPKAVAPTHVVRHPIETLRHEIDRLFDTVGRPSWPAPLQRTILELEPFWQRALQWGSEPAVDVIENDKAYQVTAELPGLDDKNVEVTFANGSLVIKGEKKEEKEEKKTDYYRQERRVGSFERRFQIPNGVDADKIDATFKKGLLTVTLPKTPAAQKASKKIDIKAA